MKSALRLVLLMLLLRASLAFGLPQLRKTAKTLASKGAAPLLVANSLRGGGAGNWITGGYKWYTCQCTEHPFVTKSITAAIVTSLGDILAQRIEGKDLETLNKIRLKSFFLCGLLYVGPFVHTWYEQLWKLGRWMESRHGITNPTLQTLAQLFTDQTLGVLIFFPSYFYVFELIESLVARRRPSLQRANTKCYQQIKSVFWMQYRIYPITNYISFAFIPESLRVLASNIVSLLFNIYLTMKVGG